jgi:hypothetical protein
VVGDVKAYCQFPHILKPKKKMSIEIAHKAVKCNEVFYFSLSNNSSLNGQILLVSDNDGQVP